MVAKKVKEVKEVAEEVTEQLTPSPVEEETTETPAEEVTEVKEVKEEKKGKVEIKEEEYKSVNLLKAPEEIKKIIQFYGITGKDLFEGKFDGVKEEEAKALKEWYASLV